MLDIVYMYYVRHNIFLSCASRAPTQSTLKKTPFKITRSHTELVTNNQLYPRAPTRSHASLCTSHALTQICSTPSYAQHSTKIHVFPRKPRKPMHLTRSRTKPYAKPTHIVPQKTQKIKGESWAKNFGWQHDGSICSFELSLPRLFKNFGNLFSAC